jgi:hypothetical protein
MRDSHSGACLCGAVRFEIDGPLEHFYLCHCSRCRKDTGSAHASTLFSGRAYLVWQSGAEHIHTFRLAGTRHQKSFCTRCGSALPYALENGQDIAVPAGSLDTPITLPPEAHICWASRADWEDQLADAPRLDDLPG